VEEELPDHIA
jgi:predicted ribosome quality control (RQC) complex YloA/Tae2 family protein